MTKEGLPKREELIRDLVKKTEPAITYTSGKGYSQERAEPLEVTSLAC